MARWLDPASPQYKLDRGAAAEFSVSCMVTSIRPGPGPPTSTTTTFSKLTWIMVIMVKFEAETQ